MSHDATVAAWAFLRDPEHASFDVFTVAVLLTLADRHNGMTGRVDPSITGIAKDCHCSTSSVKRALDVLERAGAIKRIPGGAGTRNQYRLDIPQPGSHRPGSVSTRFQENQHLVPTGPGGGSVGTTNQELTGKEPTDGRASLISQVLDEYTMSVCLSHRNTARKFHDSVLAKATEERTPVIVAYLARHPNATIDDLRELMRLDRQDGHRPTEPPAPTHDPDCVFCAGSGWATVDIDTNTVGPCDCRYSPPALRVLDGGA